MFPCGHTAQETARSSHADQGKGRTGTFVTSITLQTLFYLQWNLAANEHKFASHVLCVLPSVELTQHVSIHTSVHKHTHTHSWLQLQTTSKENAGVQKNVVSLITRNRITVCKCVYMYLLHSEILVVNIYVLPSSHLSHMHTHIHTHTHTHPHTHTPTHATHTYTHLSSKSWVSMAKESAQKLSLEVSVPFVTETGEGRRRGRGGEGKGLHAVLVTLECQLNQFSSSFDRKSTW